MANEQRNKLIEFLREELAAEEMVESGQKAKKVVASRETNRRLRTLKREKTFLLSMKQLVNIDNSTIREQNQGSDLS